jgi:hypothetical protein
MVKLFAEKGKKKKEINFFDDQKVKRKIDNKKIIQI